MTQYLRCARHGVTLKDEPGKRHFTLAPDKGGQVVCALMLHPSPHAGRLPMINPETGVETAGYCDIEEVGGGGA